MGVPISNVTRRVVYAASGTGPYNFSFEILAAGDIAVYKDDTLLTLTTNYTVTINANGTGYVTLTATPTGATQIAIVGNRTIQRATDFVTGGDFFANTVNAELDQQTIFAQQNAEGLQRALQAPQTDPTSINMTLPRKADRAGKYLAFDANGNPVPGDTAVEVAGVYAIRNEIAAVDAIDAQVVTVAGISTNVTTVAGISSNVTTVAGNNANVTTVATNIASVNTAASNIVAIQNASTNATNAANSATAAAASESAAAASAAAAATALDNFDDRYLGPKSSNPTLDNDGNALLTGALYYRTTAPIGMKVYDGSQWLEASAAQQAALVTYEFVATAGQTTFSGADANALTLSYIAGGVMVSLNGVILRPGDDYTASNGTSIVLVSAAALGDELVVYAFSSFTVANTYTKTEVDDFAVNVTSNQTIGGVKTFSQPIVGSLNGNASTATTATNATSASYATNARGVFFKADPNTVAFTRTGNGTVSVKAGTVVDVKGTPVAFASATAVTMPTLSSGTDYAIYACADGSIRADASFTAPSGYTTANSRQIGGFHYAPGGNAAAQAGGDTTPQINAFSLWDLKFRPACPDPRGMTLVADGFWADIYLLGVDHLVNGTSKFNVTIADGSSPPRVPTKFGGNGTTTYTTLNWWEAREVMVHHGKRLPTYGEFAALAYGTTEATQGGTDPGSTILRNAFTSRWGVMLAAGNMWVWGDEFGGGAASAAWTANTGGRGSTYQMENAVFFGGFWGDGANCGSRCSSWNLSPSSSLYSIGARGVCDHLILD